VDYDDLKLCNCAGCGCELAAPGQADLLLALKLTHKGDPIPVPLAGRLDGRPYCSACLLPDRSETNTLNSLTPRQQSRGEQEGDGDNPWLEKATRDLTEGQQE
jgi:hypothetical protein